MKSVKNEIINTIQGKPFRIPETDDRGETITIDSKPKMRDAKTVDLLRLFVLNLPPPKLTMKDSLEAHRLFKQIEQAKDGIIAIEEAEHDWIKEKVEEFAPGVFGINAIMLKEALDNFERLHEAEGKKTAKPDSAKSKEKPQSD